MMAVDRLRRVSFLTSRTLGVGFLVLAILATSCSSQDDGAGPEVAAGDELLGRDLVDGSPIATVARPPATLPEANLDAIVDPDGEETAVEPGTGTPDLETELAAVDLESPCDLFSDSQLGESMSEWSAEAGLFAELPSGLGNDTTLEFVTASSGEAACEWFSESHIWFVGVSWEVADPTFMQIIAQRFDDQPQARSFEIGDVSVFVTNDVTAELLAAGLHVTVSNLVPSAQTVSGDIEVTAALAEEIARRLA